MKKFLCFLCVVMLCSLLCACQAKSTEMIVYLDDSLSDAEGKAIGTKILQIEDVHSATYVSAEEALEQFMSNYEGDSAFSGIEASYLRSRYVVQVSGANVDAVTAQLLEIEGIDDVKNGSERTQALVLRAWIMEKLFGKDTALIP